MKKALLLLPLLFLLVGCSININPRAGSSENPTPLIKYSPKLYGENIVCNDGKTFKEFSNWQKLTYYYIGQLDQKEIKKIKGELGGQSFIFDEDAYKEIPGSLGFAPPPHCLLYYYGQGNKKIDFKQCEKYTQSLQNLLDPILPQSKNLNYDYIIIQPMKGGPGPDNGIHIKDIDIYADGRALPKTDRLIIEIGDAKSSLIELIKKQGKAGASSNIFEIYATINNPGSQTATQYWIYLAKKLFQPTNLEELCQLPYSADAKNITSGADSDKGAELYNY